MEIQYISRYDHFFFFFGGGGGGSCQKEQISARWGGGEEVGEGSRDGAMVKALASHYCAPGSIPGVDAMWVDYNST